VGGSQGINSLSNSLSRLKPTGLNFFHLNISFLLPATTAGCSFALKSQVIWLTNTVLILQREQKILKKKNKKK
jgi:hypothetical protein